MSKTIYVAGPMRGIRHFNFPAFDAARDRLAAQGWNVISPADLDREIGFDEKAFPDDYGWIDLKKIGFSIQDAVERDVEALIRSEAIYMLRGWEKSKGATAEKAIAEWLGLEVIYEGVEEYRYLEVGETIDKGDERYFDIGGWGRTSNGGRLVESHHIGLYRRKVVADPPKPPKVEPSNADTGTGAAVEYISTPPQEDILEEALRITRGDRQAQYGPPDQDFRRSAGMLTALFADSLLKEGAKFEPFHIAQMMILLKMSRQLHQRKRDNWVDTAGYARCGAICDEVAK